MGSRVYTTVVGLGFGFSAESLLGQHRVSDAALAGNEMRHLLMLYGSRSCYMRACLFAGSGSIKFNSAHTVATLFQNSALNVTRLSSSNEYRLQNGSKRDA